MKWTRRRIVTIGVVAAVLALTITSFASGLSLRKLVKKEVSRQISAATGPQGPQGAPGPPGAQGTQGLQGPGTIVATGTISSPGNLFAGSCTGTLSAAAPGVLASDHVVITPPSTWPSSAANVHGVAANGTVSYTICTHFAADFGTAIDVKFLVLRP
jgi:hypothetical protein